ncbi:RNase H domain-containing protein [Trichonephila clavipes]|nr:RNase H domain-containing protein [Trichonephila clavipes]
MALYRSPLTVTLWPSSFSKKYGPMIPPAHKAHQTDIIIGAVSSTNNVTAENECGLPSLKGRRKLTPIKFTNKIRSCCEQHISNITFRSWKAKNRLKRSSTLQFDKDTRKDINLNHTSLDIIQVPCFPVKSPPSTKIILDLLEPCTKKEPKNTIKRKDMDTVIGLMRPRLVTAYTDDSSDSECNRGGSGVYPDNTTSNHKVFAGQIASNFTCEHRAIRTVLDIYLTWTDIANSDYIIVLSNCRYALETIKEGKMRLTQEINSLLFYIGALVKLCNLQGIPDNVDIGGTRWSISLPIKSEHLSL